jgi:hypothetical protein
MFILIIIYFRIVTVELSLCSYFVCNGLQIVDKESYALPLIPHPSHLGISFIDKLFPHEYH